MVSEWHVRCHSSHNSHSTKKTTTQHNKTYIISPTHTRHSTQHTVKIKIHFSASFRPQCQDMIGKVARCLPPQSHRCYSWRASCGRHGCLKSRRWPSPKKCTPGHQHSPWKIPVGRRFSYWNDPFFQATCSFSGGFHQVCGGVVWCIFWGNGTCRSKNSNQKRTSAGNSFLCWCPLLNLHIQQGPPSPFNHPTLGIIAPHHLTASQPYRKGVFPKMAIYTPKTPVKHPPKMVTF